MNVASQLPALKSFIQNSSLFLTGFSIEKSCIWNGENIDQEDVCKRVTFCTDNSKFWRKEVFVLRINCTYIRDVLLLGFGCLKIYAKNISCWNYSLSEDIFSADGSFHYIWSCLKKTRKNVKVILNRPQKLQPTCKSANRTTLSVPDYQCVFIFGAGNGSSCIIHILCPIPNT